MTLKEKHLNDPAFYKLVLTIEGMLSRKEFTPLEMRQAVTLACIRHAVWNQPRDRDIPEEVERVLRTIEEFQEAED